MNVFDLVNRSRSEWIVGLWATAPVLGLPILWLVWQNHLASEAATQDLFDSGYTPVTTGMLLLLLGFLVVLVIAAGLMVREIGRRPMTSGMRKVWAILAIFGAPFGGFAYWLIYCHAGASAEPIAGASEVPAAEGS
jgi:hypothetical protein